MQYYDFLPDIHGDLEKLEGTLEALGYSLDDYSHPEGHQIILLGDYIDRGDQNLAVLQRVKGILASGRGQAVMGNHELNAILYHTSDGYGDGLRVRDESNTHQHEAFLREARLGSAAADEAISFMKTLPLFLELDGIRAVHACWNDAAVQVMNFLRPGGRFLESDLRDISMEYEGGAVAGAVTMLAKGPECHLPNGLSFTDKGGVLRKKARLRWWGENRDLHDALASIDDMSVIPHGPAPAEAHDKRYPDDAPPVIFGHYQLKTGFEMRHNTLCLDVPGQYHAYRWRGEAYLEAVNIHAISGPTIEP